MVANAAFLQKLRDYQKAGAMDAFHKLEEGKTPVIELAPGAGKSWVIAALAAMLQRLGGVLVLAHRKELIAQNHEKLMQVWPECNAGIVSAGLGLKQFDRQIIVGSIQSVARHADKLGHIKHIIVDECHYINHNDQGQYRTLIDAIGCKVVGLTATPYRMGHGLITDGDAIFNSIIKPAEIFELIDRGFLAPLKSKHTGLMLDFSDVRKRGGEWVENDLDEIVNNELVNDFIIEKTKSMAVDLGYSHILIFCVTVDHAVHLAAKFNELDIMAGFVHGTMTSCERDAIISQFKNGDFQVLCNVNILTVGFDFPNIDCVVMARPTLSPALYVQMAGRGLRLKAHTDHCRVLDFVGNINTHGPITAVEPPVKHGRTKIGEAPVKFCPDCFEVIHLRVVQCECGFIFQSELEKKAPLAISAVNSHDHADIMGQPYWVDIKKLKFEKHVKKSNGTEMLKAVFFPKSLFDKPIIDYYTPSLPWKITALVTMVAKLGMDKDYARALLEGKYFDAFISAFEIANKTARIASIQVRNNKGFLNVKKCEYAPIE